MIRAAASTQPLYRRPFLKTENQRADADGLVDEVIAIARDESYGRFANRECGRALYTALSGRRVTLGRGITNRWTRAAGACFATSLVRRRVL